MDDELKDYQDPDNWIDDESSPREPVKSPRAVVSVRFSREDLTLVADAARRSGLRSSEFIRAAALNRAGNSLAPNSGDVHSMTGPSVKSGYPGNQRRGPKFTLTVRSRIGELLSGH